MKKGKRKILFLIESLSGGGAEKVLTTLLTHLDYTRFEATLCCVVNVGKYLSALPPQLHYVYLLPDADTVGGWQRWGYRLKYNLIYHWLPLRWVYRWWLPKGNHVEVAFVEGFTTKLLACSTNSKARRYAWLHTNFGHNHWTTALYGSLEAELSAYAHYGFPCYEEAISVISFCYLVCVAIKFYFDNVNLIARVHYYICAPAGSAHFYVHELTEHTEDYVEQGLVIALIIFGNAVGIRNGREECLYVF